MNLTKLFKIIFENQYLHEKITALHGRFLNALVDLEGFS